MRSILFVSPVGEIGGGEKVLLCLADYMHRSGIKIFFACLRPGPLEEASAQYGNVFVFRSHRYRQIFTVIAARRWLKRVIEMIKPDIIHANHSAWLYVMGLRIPTVLHLHDYPHRFDILDLANRLWRPRHVIYTSEFVKTGFAHLAKAKSAVIAPWCVNVEELSTAVPNAEIRRQFELGDGPLFVTVARLQSHKGHRVLLEAVHRLRTATPDVRFLIVGKAGDAEQRAYEQALKDMVVLKQLQHRVRFLGFVKDADLRNLYYAAEALIHPAITEGYGLVLIEAMACGTPVLAADATGPAMVLAGTEGGTLVPKGDAEALANAIDLILNNPNWKAERQAAAQDRAKQFSSSIMCARTLGFYGEILAH